MSASSSRLRLSAKCKQIRRTQFEKRTDSSKKQNKEVEPLFIREEELENEEIIAICRKNNITISDLMAKVNREKAEVKKEKTNENQFEKE